MGIVDFLKLWVKDIAIIFILISIIEILLPNSSMKRYIDMVVGFLIIIVIITPFVKLVLKDFNIDREVFRNIIEQNELEKGNNLDLSSIQEEQLKEVYISKIKGEVKEIIVEYTNYEVENIKISIDEEETNYGSVKEIEIILNNYKELEKETENIITVAKIEEISIGEKNNELTELIGLEDDKEIKRIISNNYNISEENIKVFLNTIGEGGMDG